MCVRFRVDDRSSLIFDEFLFIYFHAYASINVWRVKNVRSVAGVHRGPVYMLIGLLPLPLRKDVAHSTPSGIAGDGFPLVHALPPFRRRLADRC
jgi:hypothetical protein